jgi:hypothetical protein
MTLYLLDLEKYETPQHSIFVSVIHFYCSTTGMMYHLY